MFVYSLKDMCPLSQPQKQFSSPAVITCMFPVPEREQVRSSHTHARTHTHTHTDTHKLMCYMYVLFISEGKKDGRNLKKSFRDHTSPTTGRHAIDIQRI